MTDPRPRPEYGEYATPEQQAAAMGRAMAPPVPPAALAMVAAPGIPAAEPSTRAFRLRGNLVDRFFTIFQLGIGLVFLIRVDYFHLAQDANVDFAELGITQKIPLAIDQYAWWLLAANIVLLLGTAVWAYTTLRRGKLAFYIPLVGYLVFSSVLGVVISIVR